MLPYILAQPCDKIWQPSGYLPQNNTVYRKFIKKSNVSADKATFYKQKL